MIIFGKEREKPEKLETGQIIEEANQQQGKLATTSIDQIIETLHMVGQQWHKGSHYYNQAKMGLKKEIDFSNEMIEHSLAIIPQLLDRDNLGQRVSSELGSKQILDSFAYSNNFSGKIRAFPLGKILHVSAGNIFLGCIDSLLMGLITKNVSIIKLSSKNQFFPKLFAQSIIDIDTDNIIADKFAILHWKGGENEIEDIFKEKMDAIIAWGGEEMVTSYKNKLGRSTKLLDYGPKISIQVIMKKELENSNLTKIAKKIAEDLALWDQSACASPQNLFFQEGIDHQALMDAVAAALESYPIPRGKISANEAVEILKEKQRGKYSRLLENGYEKEGDDYYLTLDPSTPSTLKPSPLNRTLIFKPFTDIAQLKKSLAPFSFYLQSCGYLANQKEQEELLDALGTIGMKRFAKLGDMLKGVTGAPHDGSYALTELVNLVPDERPYHQLLDFVDAVCQHVPYFQENLQDRYERFEDIPLMSSQTICDNSLAKDSSLLDRRIKEGKIFSSGGTSGNPKFCFYTSSEYEEIAQLLAHGIKVQGVKAGDTVANLFTAGNFWSSFTFVERALAICETTQLPIGGLTETPLLIRYLQNFKPTAILGLPSLMVGYANYALEHEIKLEIPTIFYAGEHLNQSSRKFLNKVFNTGKFCSAGYASVDAGIIGYQCPYCSGGEHHLFADQIHLEIINNEGVVTSKIRKAMPIIRYRTGDQIQWLDEEHCQCQSKDPRFNLLGRLDGMINIWSCKINIKDIEVTIDQLEIDAPIFQITLKQEAQGEQLKEILEIKLETPNFNIKKFKEIIFDNCRDLKSTFTLKEIAPLIQIEAVKNNTIERVGRTGKVKRVIDNRT